MGLIYKIYGFGSPRWSTVCEGFYKPVETCFQSTRSMVLGVLGVALCVSGCSGYLQSGEFYCTS